MTGRVVSLLGLLLLTAGCVTANGGSAASNPGPRTRCLQAPQRSQDYTADRPFFYFMCVESP